MVFEKEKKICANKFTVYPEENYLFDRKWISEKECSKTDMPSIKINQTKVNLLVFLSN